MSIDADFNAAYWLHQPKSVRPLQSIADIADRAALAETLASEGFTIDPAIMIQGWPPFMVMSFRKQLGQTWEAPLGKPQVLVSAMPPAVITDFTQPPPDYAILTSTNIADYAPLDPPPPPPPAPSTSPIAAFAYTNDAGQDVYFNNPDVDSGGNGTVFPSAGASPRYVKTVRATPFGKAQSWTKVA